MNLSAARDSLLESVSFSRTFKFVPTGTSGATVLRVAGFFKLREISASYTLPDKWAGAIGAQRATITVTRNGESRDLQVTFGSKPNN